MELIDQLTKNLGVSKTQAEGGVGLLFRQAKENLNGSDFSKLSTAVPGLDKLISAAPATGAPVRGGATSGGLGDLGSLLSGSGGAAGGAGGLGDLGNMLSGLGSTGGGSGSLPGLAGGFSKLGLDSSMIAKFLPIILSFLQSKGGEGLKGILGNAFK